MNVIIHYSPLLVYCLLYMEQILPLNFLYFYLDILFVHQ
ncbi:hypothetical protein BAA_A0096 (plasmid) [Bacillus anthracis str. A0248]|nr:hypothetical protein BAA_A0096 [Bacillus anthracis str. A0248]